jgi:hypothetical protein
MKSQPTSDEDHIGTTVRGGVGPRCGGRHLYAMVRAWVND